MVVNAKVTISADVHKAGEAIIAKLEDYKDQYAKSHAKMELVNKTELVNVKRDGAESFAMKDTSAERMARKRPDKTTLTLLV